MHQVKNQPLLKFAWDVQNLIQTIESNNPDPGPMRSVWDTICMAMKQVNEPQVRVVHIKKYYRGCMIRLQDRNLQVLFRARTEITRLLVNRFQILSNMLTI